jgi:hypothetical protein
MEKISYGGWPNCLRLANVSVELVATSDVGPRIIRFGFQGGENEFYEDESQLGKTGSGDFLLYGGHRLWAAPEAMPLTYYPDNGRVKAGMKDGILTLTAPVETTTGIGKEISIFLDPFSDRVSVRHRLKNFGSSTVRLAPWALTVMKSGGVAVFPQEEYAAHSSADGYSLLPNRSLALWPYTDLSDSRLRFTGRLILLRQDPSAESPLKLGFSNRRGWAAYIRGSSMFVKRSSYVEGAEYPDLGSSFESFTNSEMLELETLGPLASLEPGQSATLDEEWFLFGGIRIPETGDALEALLIDKMKPFA